MTRNKIFTASFLIFLGFLAYFPIQKDGAKLLLSPKSTIIIKNSVFTMGVEFNTSKPINAIEGTLNFNPEFLEITNISLKESAINIWIKEPIFSNEKGRLSFSGGILPNTQYLEKGNLFFITFLAKKAGSGTINFTETKVLANDGEGTSVLQETINADYTIKEQIHLINDFNNDGKKDLTDLSIFLNHLNNNKEDNLYDLNKDGQVDLTDLSIFLAQ